MSTRQAVLKLRPGAANIVINGTDIADSVESVFLKGAYNKVPQLLLTLSMPLVEVDGELTVTVPPATHHALVQLGWTPPAGGGGE